LPNRRGDDDAKTIQPEVQGQSGAGGDPRAADFELASQFGVHPVQIGHWRRTAIEQMAELFADGRKQKQRGGDAEDREALFAEIGRLKFELDWIKKKAGLLE